MTSKWPAASFRIISLIASALAIVLFVIAMPLAHAQFKVIYSFTGGADGGWPEGGVAFDAKGNAYVTTQFGGNLSCNPPLGCGTVVKIDTTGKETVLHAFNGGTDGAYPYITAMLAMGYIWGTTSAGGGASGCFGSGCGTRFKIKISTLQYNVTYSFTGGTDGGMPFGGLTLGKGGILYGVTAFGGDLSCGVAPAGCGVLYQVDAAGKQTTLYSFTGSTDGANPLYGNVVFDKAHNFVYLTTQKGGDLTCNPPFGCGALDEWDIVSQVMKTVARYPSPTATFPDSQPTLYKKAVYGVAALGGANGKGTVVKYDQVTGKFVVLHDFGNGTDGATPIGGVVFDASGNLFGTTELGGQFGNGTLFKIDTTGAETVVHDFNLTTDGGVPVGAITYNSKTKNLYGTALESSPGSGIVWSYKP